MLVDKDLGSIDFVLHERSKRIKVRILPQGLRVTMPLRATEKEALRFIDSIRDKLMLKQQQINKKQQQNALFIDEKNELKTRTFIVKMMRTDTEKLFFRFEQGTLYIEAPRSLDCNVSQQLFWNGINYFLRKEARRVLPERINSLSLAHELPFSSLKIQSSKSRWGSCSSAKNINLSFYLLLLPQHLIDYVILHELCHTKEMNHSERFWSLMDKVTGNTTKALRKELRSYSMPI